LKIYEDLAFGLR